MRSLSLHAAVTAILVASASADPPRTAAVTARGYASPQDVFNAFRAAQERRDWQTVFYCSTPEAKEWHVAEAWLACNLKSHRPEIRAILKSYRVEQGAVTAEYLQQYRRKHKIDIAKVPDGSQLPDVDHELLRQVVCGLIADKAAFYEAVSKLTADPDGPGIGPLESLRVQGDTAVGRSSHALYHWRNVGHGLEKMTTAVPLTVRFRRVQDGWLVEHH